MPAHEWFLNLLVSWRTGYYKVSKYLHTHNSKRKSFAIMLVLKTDLFQAIDITGDNLSITWISHLFIYNYIYKKHDVFFRWMLKTTPSWTELHRNTHNLYMSTQTHTHSNIYQLFRSTRYEPHPTTFHAATLHLVSDKRF